MSEKSRAGSTMALSEVLVEWERITDHRPRPSGSGFSGLCPLHDAQNPSLSIWEGDDGNVRIECHAGCDTKVILDWLKLDYESG